MKRKIEASPKATDFIASRQVKWSLAYCPHNRAAKPYGVKEV
jgi:hypothetical protein